MKLVREIHTYMSTWTWQSFHDMPSSVWHAAGSVGEKHWDLKTMLYREKGPCEISSDGTKYFNHKNT
jgi:hypothetical protein